VRFGRLRLAGSLVCLEPEELGLIVQARLKRWGTVLCVIGMFLNAFNIYPLNIVFSAIGSSMWAAVGFGTRDKDLFVVEITAVAFAVSGLAWWFFR
jgi:hypothetical protein